MRFLDRDIWIGIAMLLLSAGYWREADRIPASPLSGGVGADGLPKALAYALGALAVALIVRSVIGAAMARRPARLGPGQTAPGAATDWRAHIRAGGMLAIGVTYLLVIPVIGYPVTIGLLLLVVSLYIGAPFGLKTIAVAVLGGVFFQLLFVVFLDIPLPQGDLASMLFSAAPAPSTP